MNVPLLLIVALGTIVNVSSFFAVASKAPQYTVFTGAVHYPPDYQYYLSFITQGTDHWLRAYHLYTGETMTPELGNWIYVLAGHIGSLAYISAPITYQLMVAAGSVFYLLIAYKLIGLCVRGNRQIQLVVYILFLLSNALPNIHMENGSWIFGYFYPFNNLGHPLLRLTNVPHHLFISCFIMSSFFVANVVSREHKKLQMVSIGILGFLLASMQPLQWALTGTAMGLTGIVVWIRSKKHSLFLSALIFCIAGIIPALYLQKLYSLPPYSNMLAWEKLQQVRIPFIHFLRLNGPAMILGIIGIPLIVKKLNVPTIMLLLSAFISTVLFFSPIPQLFNMLNLRFISISTTLAASVVAGQLIFMIAGKIDGKRTVLCAWFLVIVTLAITFPVTWDQYIGRNTMALPSDMNTYLPLGAQMVYEKAKKIIGPTDIVLADFIFSISFSGMTGKHVYVAHALGTIDFQRKLGEANAFFYHPQGQNERIDWLTKNNISYILTHAWIPVDLPNLEVVAESAYARLYKVK